MCLLAGVAAAQSWKGLGPSDFPAEVKAIVFRTGNALDRENSLSWGQWTVRFGSGKVIAELYDPGNGSMPSINITGLICSNPVAGEKACSLNLADTQGGNPPEACVFYVRDQGVRPLQIRCPVSIKFTQ